ncbi:FAD-dependent oxidoreductase [Nocardia sp. BMG51109]|uniref:FAD-dependent oxidoreductase n=1 Tax=Nocardia sp. BMG51109 TaxID=1056816 RepID=UPI0004AF5813|nr:FAD-dependent oxidoreductase [Nocardia sp. BMG51109]
MRHDNAVVVGGGVSGLTSALCLAEAGVNVRVWAAEPPEQTTSMVAGALWGPSFQEPVERTLAWTRQSLDDFRDLAGRPATGVRMASGLTVGQLPPADRLPPQAQMIPDLRACPADELPGGYPAGFTGTMPLIDMPIYLRYLTDRLIAAGGVLETRRVSSLTEAAEAAPIVVNCSGLGARELAGDTALRPVFGQVVVLTNPGLREIFLELSAGPEFTHLVPHADRVLCGGVSKPDVWDRTPDPDVSRSIVDRCRRIEPRLHDAEIVDVVTGLRPDRPAVRVEATTIGTARCVHNYGHSGSGVSLSWGCARDTARLALGGQCSS